MTINAHNRNDAGAFDDAQSHHMLRVRKADGSETVQRFDWAEAEQAKAAWGKATWDEDVVSAKLFTHFVTLAQQFGS